MLLTNGTQIAGRLHMISLNMLVDIGLHFGAATAFQTQPLTVGTLAHFRPYETVQICNTRKSLDLKAVLRIRNRMFLNLLDLD
jgi:hypothetical protein